MYTGKQIKEMIDRHISDEDIICIGEEGDILGRNDRQIIGVEKRKIGFDANDTYKVIITKPFGINGTMKFWNK